MSFLVPEESFDRGVKPVATVVNFAKDVHLFLDAVGAQKVVFSSDIGNAKVLGEAMRPVAGVTLARRICRVMNLPMDGTLETLLRRAGLMLIGQTRTLLHFRS